MMHPPGAKNGFPPVDMAQITLQWQMKMQAIQLYQTQDTSGQEMVSHVGGGASASDVIVTMLWLVLARGNFCAMF